MPAKSKAQANLMRAAEHGAQFPMAQKVRASMSLGQLHDYAKGSTQGKPEQVNGAAKAGGHPHRNLGKFLHPKKGR